MSAISPLVGAIDMALEAVRQPGPRDEDRLVGALTDARELALEATREIDRLSVRYIAQLRLYEDLQVEKICDAIADIVIYFLGSEDFVIYLADGGGSLYPVRGMGPADDAAGGVEKAELLAGVARDGVIRYDLEGWIAVAPMHDATGTMRGVLGLRSLLRHKPSFTDEDRSVLDELRSHAGRALGWMLARGAART